MEPKQPTDPARYVPTVDKEEQETGGAGDSSPASRAINSSGAAEGAETPSAGAVGEAADALDEEVPAAHGERTANADTPATVSAKSQPSHPPAATREGFQEIEEVRGPGGAPRDQASPQHTSPTAQPPQQQHAAGQAFQQQQHPFSAPQQQLLPPPHALPALQHQQHNGSVLHHTPPLPPPPQQQHQLQHYEHQRQQQAGLDDRVQPAGAGTPSKSGWKPEAPRPAGPNSASRDKTRAGHIKKCVECGSTDTPMWRTHPVHGRGTLCNACGVKLYRQQCKDRTQREKSAPGMAGSAPWGNGMAPEDLLAAQGSAPGDGWDRQNQHKRQKTEQVAQPLGRAKKDAYAAGALGQLLAATGNLQGAAVNSMLLPVLAKALTAAVTAPALQANANANASPLDRHQSDHLHIPGCQFAFRGQLPDGSIEPRAIHDVTITLQSPREPGASILQSHIAVLDAAGGGLATYHTAEVEPRLEYDHYLNAAVWDSRNGWWLLLPTPEHAMAFQGMMRVLAARKLGMRHPPALPDVLPLPQLPQQQVAQGPVPQQHGGAAAAPTRAQPPAQPQAQLPMAALQQPAEQLGRAEAAQQGGGDQAQEAQRLMALLAQGLSGMLPGGGNRANPSADKAAPPQQQQPQAQQQPQSQQPPRAPKDGAAPAGLAKPLAHQAQLGRSIPVPSHHSLANPSPATTKVPESAAGKQPVSSGPMPFAPPPPAGNLFAGHVSVKQELRADEQPGPQPAPSTQLRQAGPGVQARQADLAPPSQQQQQQQQGSLLYQSQHEHEPARTGQEQQQQQQQREAPGSAARAPGGPAAAAVQPRSGSAFQQPRGDAGQQYANFQESDAALYLLAALQQRVSGSL